MIKAWIRDVRFKKSYKSRKNRKENRKTEQLLYLCTRKIELRTSLQLTFAIFRMRGCFARCTRKIESRTSLQPTFAIFLVRGCFARCNQKESLRCKTLTFAYAVSLSKELKSPRGAKTYVSTFISLAYLRMNITSSLSLYGIMPNWSAA